MSDTTQRNLVSIDEGEYFQQVRGDVAALVPLDCRSILEVGSGFGALGRVLIDRQGCELDGIEINPLAAEHLAGCYRRFWIGDAEKCSLEGIADDYDCLLFPDVLEHLVNPWAVLSRLVGNLCSGGYVVASIPNIRNLAILYRLIVQGRWAYESSGVLDRGHLRFFTRQSIAAMFAETGLVIETWHMNRDRYAGSRKLVSAIAKLAMPEIDVCQYIVRARKP